MKACRKVGKEYVFYFQCSFSPVHTWCMPQPRTCYLGKTQVTQGDRQVEQGPPSLRWKKALGLKLLVIAKVEISKWEYCHV